MSVNYNDRTGVLGIDLTPQFNNSFQTAGLFGFGKSDEEKALEQIQNLRKDQETITAPAKGNLNLLKESNELQYNKYQDIQKQIENLKKQYPNDSSIQSASLPSNRYTASKISNYDDLFGAQTFTDALGTTRTLPGLDRPDINTAPFNVNEGVTNTNSFRSMLLDDLRSLPGDFRTSLGQTKDALVEDVSGLGSFLKDKSMNLFNSGKDLGKTAISGLISLATGIPGTGLILDAFQMSPEEKAARDFYEKKYGLTNTGQVASGIMQGYTPVSMFGGPGLLNSIDKRLATILRTEQRKKDKNLELSQELINRRKELEALRAQESASASDFLESQRIGRRPGSGGTVDRVTSGPGRNVDDTGQAYDTRGREGFGYGL